MSVRRHAVRKLELPHDRSLDERLGVVQLGIWALTVYLVGVLWWAWQDGTPAGWDRWTVGATVVTGLAGIISLALCAVPPRWLHRGLVIALCLSLALHLSVVAALSRVHLVVPRAARPTEAPPVPPPPPVPEAQDAPPEESFVPLALAGIERDEPAERQPVPSGEVDLPPRERPRSTRLTAPESLPLKIDGMPDVPRKPPLTMIERQEYAESVPRRDQWEGRLSRQETATDWIENQAAQVPLELPDSAEANNTPAAVPDPLTRRFVSPGRRLTSPLQRRGDPPPISDSARPPLPSDLTDRRMKGDASSARSKHDLDLPLVVDDSSSARMAAPTRSITPDTGARRRLVPGGPITDSLRVETAGPISIEADEPSGPVPAKSSTVAADPRRGQTSLPDAVRRAAGIPLEVGMPRPRPTMPEKQPSAGTAPQVVSSTAERLTTGRTLDGVRRPALPTDVRAIDIEIPKDSSNNRAPASASVGEPGVPRAGALTKSANVRPPVPLASLDPPDSAAVDAGASAERVVVTDRPPLEVFAGAPRPVRERRPLALPFAPDASVDEPLRLAAQPTSTSGQPSVPTATSTATDRRIRGVLPVLVEAPPGTGGLSLDIALDVGSISRRAQPDVDRVVDSAGRFIRQPVGGPLSIDRTVLLPTRAYESRIDRRGERPVSGNGATTLRTEQAIEAGLVYLADHQRADGSWSLMEAGEAENDKSADSVSIRSDTAASGLSLLTFLGAGYHHRSDQHGTIVRDGLKYLIDHQQPNGDLYVRADATSNRSAWMYSHAIAAIALCEAYGMTQDPELREPAQLAVDFIVQAQHSQRGGWRYAPGVGSDTSVSGWMVMALRNAELANLTVPIEVWQRVESWLDLAKDSAERPELHRYNPLAPNTKTQGHGRRPTKTMTAVGLLMRLYTGWRRDDPQMKAGAEYLLDNLPEYGSTRDPQRDTYYWYYATQVMFHMRGEYWERWNDRLHELLTQTQQQQGPTAGSWDPWAPLPDRWAPHAGRLYVTTMNLLSLEVDHRHLPIYEDTAR